LQGNQALRYFKAAWTAMATAVEPLALARGVYWQLGKFDTVQTVIQRTLEVAEGATKAELLCELGDVSCDLGNYDGAAEYYQQAEALVGRRRAMPRSA